MTLEEFYIALEEALKTGQYKNFQTGDSRIRVNHIDDDYSNYTCLCPIYVVYHYKTNCTSNNDNWRTLAVCINLDLDTARKITSSADHDMVDYDSDPGIRARLKKIWEGIKQ